MKKQNEVNAINALVQILTFITGSAYGLESSPDDETSQRKEVDYILTSESQRLPPLAVEHTIAEAFRGQITYVNRSYEIVAHINALCKRDLPSNRYFILVVPDVLIESLRKQAILRFVNSVAEWVGRSAPRLSIDEHRTLIYEDSEIHLLCGGSHPDINGTIGRIPRRPDDQTDRARQSVWLSIEHGFGKFSRYKEIGYETVLCLQNISGEVHPSMLTGIERDAQKKEVVSKLIDYIIVFDSVEDRMVVGNVWKEKELRYDPVPFNRRFSNNTGKWSPFE